MKNVRKLLALVMAVAMICSLAISASAATPLSEGLGVNVTFTNMPSSHVTALVNEVEVLSSTQVKVVFNSPVSFGSATGYITNAYLTTGIETSYTVSFDSTGTLPYMIITCPAGTTVEDFSVSVTFDMTINSHHTTGAATAVVGLEVA